MMCYYNIKTFQDPCYRLAKTAILEVFYNINNSRRIEKNVEKYVNQIRRFSK